VKINNSKWNRDWLVQAYNESVSEALGNFTVSCSATIIGGAKQFLLYLETMLNHKPFWINGRTSLDQAYHNFLLHTGVFARNGIKPAFLNCSSHIIAMHYCARGENVVSGNRIVAPDQVTIPAVVQQYQLFAPATGVIQHLCP
jgi:hypothetical protein